jgi:hypothetical protein
VKNRTSNGDTRQVAAGVGASILGQAIAYQHRGKVELDWRKDLICGLTLPYQLGVADAVGDAVILACQDHSAAARRVWLSFALPSMAQAAWPPVSPLLSDR